MKTSLTLNAVLWLLCFILMGTASQAQQLTELETATPFVIKQAFEIPLGAQSMVLDQGKGKMCSCQFFAVDTKEGETVSYTAGQELILRKVTVKGLFDGSQMHVARIYFQNTNDYFKFKCYTRNITLEHIQDFLELGKTNKTVLEE